MTRLAIFGTGRMGGLVSGLAGASGFEVTATRGAGAAREPITRDALGGAAVAIDFTVATAAPGIIRACAAAAIPVVSGTTGWDAERAAVERDVRASPGALLWAPNFALGVHLFAAVVADAARRFLAPGAGFDARLVETHHTRKLDAPSGTAKLVAARIAQASGHTVPISSVRTGDVVGTHEVIFEAPFERVRIEHEARDRRLFAAGALAAARWLVGRRGIFTIDDMLGGNTG